MKTKTNKRPGDFSLNDFYAIVEQIDQTALKHHRQKLTNEQRDMLIKARRAGMPYTQIREYWKKLGWGDFCASAIRDKYEKAIRDGR